MQLDRLTSTVMPLPVVTFTFDLLTPKPNQHIYEPEYTSDQNWVKFHSLVFEIRYSQGRRDAHLVTHGQTHPKIERLLRHWTFSLAGAQKTATLEVWWTACTKSGKIMQGRKDTFAHAVSTLLGWASPRAPPFRRLLWKLKIGTFTTGPTVRTP